MIRAFRGMLSRKLIIILVNVYSRPKCMQASTEKNCTNELTCFNYFLFFYHIALYASTIYSIVT